MPPPPPPESPPSQNSSDDQAASHGFVVPFAMEVGQSALVRPEDAYTDRSYECWQCSTPVRLRNNKKNYYFTHFKNPHQRCHPDNALHREAIVTLARFFEEHRTSGPRLAIVVLCKARGCTNVVATLAPPSHWDDLVVETNIRTTEDGRWLRPDFHVRSRGHALIGSGQYGLGSTAPMQY